jgi:adenosylcobinamide-GDP ribazoletransferase
MVSARISQLLPDVVQCVTFFTRIPLPTLPSKRSFAEALWAAPVAGALVGLITGGVLLISLSVGLSPFVAAILGVAASVLVTGALHEDGFADVADGFWGGRTPERVIEIMRDSRIGSYGTLALILSVALRWGALATIVSEGRATFIIVACIAVHSASRAILPAFAAHVPPASGTGLSASIGTIPSNRIALSLLLGAAALLAIGPAYTIVSVLLLGATFFAMKRLCIAKIGGQTGDVLGALQQACEIILLLALAANL